MTISVRIQLEKMDKITPAIQKSIMRGIDKVRFNMERDAKIFAPRATGALKASIRSTRRGFTATIQDNVHYGVYQEFGTRYQKGTPFMKPSIRKNLPNVAKIIIAEIRRVLR